MPRINNVVLVHGGFVDGSGWAGVYDLLKKDGFNVSIVQNPTISLTGDVAATRMTGPPWASTTAFVAATSPASERVGFWTMLTLKPSFFSMS